MVHLLANPSNGYGLGPRYYQDLASDQSVAPRIRQLMTFHGLGTREDAKADSQRLMEEMTANGSYLEDDEIVGAQFEDPIEILQGQLLLVPLHTSLCSEEKCWFEIRIFFQQIGQDFGGILIVLCLH